MPRLAAFGALIFFLFGAGAQSPTTESLTLSGLRNEAQIMRDARGIPYVEAANDHDLYLTQGFVTASDRLWQMELLRRTARGELAEILGPAALEEDKRRRTYGFTRVVDEVLSNLPSPVRASLEAYAEGVNAYIQTLNPANMPLEFQMLQYSPQPWRPADSLLIGKVFSETLSTTWPTDLITASMSKLPADIRGRLLPEASPLDVIVVGTDSHRSARRSAPTGFSVQSLDLGPLSPDLLNAQTELAASNNWVVSGSRTVTGKPLLANDPHLAPSAPSIWYMTHLSSRDVRVAGVTVPGTPGILIGHNESIAWGMTNLGPDVQDLFLETFDPANPSMYKTPTGWSEAQTRKEEIKVRGAQTATLQVTATRHGPIVFQNTAGSFALRWTALESDSAELSAIAALNRARNWPEFRNALRTYRGPAQNFVYADVDGHIGYYAAGKIPIRSTGDGSTPYDGSTNDGEWTRYIPFDELPHLEDPPSGVIVTANNRVVGLDYPHHLTNAWSHPNRAKRIVDLLQAKPKLSIEDFRAIQADTYSIAGRKFWEETSKLLPGVLQIWDGNVNAQSHGALMVAALRDAFRRRILTGIGGETLAGQYDWPNDPFIDQIIVEKPANLLPNGVKDYGELLRASYNEASDLLTRRIAANRTLWNWGRINDVRFPHPLAGIPAGNVFQVAPFPQNGSRSNGPGPTINVGSYVSMRMIADPSNWDRTQHGIALGQSGDPRNPHWRDQLSDWRSVSPSVLPFSEAEVRKAAVSTLTLRK